MLPEGGGTTGVLWLLSALSFTAWDDNGVSNSERDKVCPCGLDSPRPPLRQGPPWMCWSLSWAEAADMELERTRVEHCAAAVQSRTETRLCWRQTSFSAGPLFLWDAAVTLHKSSCPRQQVFPHNTLSRAVLWGRGLPWEVPVHFISFLNSSLWPQCYQSKNLQRGTPRPCFSPFV